MELTVSTDIQAPASVVWEVIVDVERSPEFLSGVDAVQRLDDGAGFGVGTRWQETRTVFGRQSTETMEVTDVDPELAYTVTSVSGATTYTSVLRVESKPDELAQLTMSFAAASTGFATRVLGATLGRLMLGATRKMLERDLADIAAEAHTRASEGDRDGDGATGTDDGGGEPRDIRH